MPNEIVYFDVITSFLTSVKKDVRFNKLDKDLEEFFSTRESLNIKALDEIFEMYLNGKIGSRPYINRLTIQLKFYVLSNSIPTITLADTKIEEIDYWSRFKKSIVQSFGFFIDFGVLDEKDRPYVHEHELDENTLEAISYNEIVFTLFLIWICKDLLIGVD